MTKVANRPKVAVILIAYFGFTVMAMSETQLGVAWPSMRDSFGVSLDALGVLLITSRIGLFVASFASGRATLYMGLGMVLLLGSVLRVLALLGYALAPDWTVLVLISVVAGFGGGAVGATLNTYFAVNHGARLTNWLHASFGLGAMLGPILMTAILNSGLSWRWGYVTTGILQALFALFLLLTLADWRGDIRATAADEAADNAPHTTRRSLWHRPVLWLSLSLFLVSAGIEATTGQWSFTLFTEARTVSVALAGLWVSVYWGSFTVGRVIFGFVADRFAYIWVMRIAIVATTGAVLLLWSNQGNAANFLAMAAMGLAQAPIAPLLISETKTRLGKAAAPAAIGYQVGAATIGIAVLPALAGVLAEALGLESLAPFLMVLCLLFLLLHEVTLRRVYGNP